jgi:hypothetical protein
VVAAAALLQLRACAPPPLQRRAISFCPASRSAHARTQLPACLFRRQRLLLLRLLFRRCLRFGAAVVVLLTLLGWLARRKPTGTLLPATVPRAPGEVVALPGAGAEHMRERLIPHLARLLMGGLVQKLISQRTGLLDTQKRAAVEMTELEDRLEKVHAPLQDRLRAYQQRIAELEKELATKGEENRELTKAKIELARKQLAAAQDRLGFN